MQLRSIGKVLVAVCVWTVAIQGAYAQSYFMGNESLGYTGTWTQFDSGNKQIASGNVGQADLLTYLSSNSNLNGAPPASNGISLQTMVYAAGGTNTPPKDMGNNYLAVFPAAGQASTQVVYNPVNNTWTATASGFTTGSGSAFDPTKDGTNPLYPLLTDAFGDWTSFSFQVMTSNGSAATEGPAGTFTSIGNSTSATGVFHGVFNNTGDNTTFVVDLTINNINASRANGGGPFIGPTDAFQGIVPEPASCLAFAMVFGASAAFGYRRVRNRRSEI